MHNFTGDFGRLQSEIIVCRKCARLVAWRERVAVEKVRRYQSEEYWGRPVPAFGDTAAGLLVIGLAPAAHGANRTGRMFTGDRSGQWLYEALHRYGFASRPESRRPGDRLRLCGCMVTAALRCAPPANKPTRRELDTCRPYLRQEMQLLHSTRVVVTLGHIAFRAFLKAWRESGRAMAVDGVPKFRHGGEWPLQEGAFLLASYHPSQQNTQTGRLTSTMFHDVFRRARILIGGRTAAE